MPIIKLAKIAAWGLDGDQGAIEHRIERQTEKAILLAKIHYSSTGERKVCYWLPKSQILVDGKKPFGEIKADAQKIEVPGWLWDKRVAV
jgi:hypothetical protein